MSKIRYYVRRLPDRTGECGPYKTREEAELMMKRRREKVDYPLYIAEVDVHKLEPVAREISDAS